MPSKKTEQKCICGIHCNVENCVHNNHHCGCTAKQIQVGPTYAASTTDTICQSFKEQTNG
ncbi:MAG: DUF1540 domain-containing protein [Massiliimalia sp.]|jgi:hypothetical protein